MDDRKNRDFSKGPVWNEAKNRWLVETRYPDGTRVRKRFRKERDALKAWSLAQVKLENGSWNTHAPRRITFGAALTLYEAHAKVQLSSAASYLKPALKVWRGGIRAETPLMRVTPAMIDAIKIARAQVVKKSSVDRNLQMLRRFFNWCIEQGFAIDSPMKRVKFFHAGTRRLRYLTEEGKKRAKSLRARKTRSETRNIVEEFGLPAEARKVVRLRQGYGGQPSREIRAKAGAPSMIRTCDLLVRRLVQVLFLEGSSLV